MEVGYSLDTEKIVAVWDGRSERVSLVVRRRWVIAQMRVNYRQQHSSSRWTALHHRGVKQSWYGGGTWPNPLETGVVSRSFGSTTDFKVNFCKIVVRNKNSSTWARPFPKQIRFPENNKHRVHIPWTLSFWVLERDYVLAIWWMFEWMDGKQDD